MNEVSLLYQLLRHVLPEDQTHVMVDVGAHFGGSLRSFARDGWTVHAFEPDPNNRARLLETIKGLDDVVVDERAVSDTCGTRLALYTSDVSTGISSLAPFHPSHRETTSVSTVTLDSYLREHGIDSVDFLKVDAEGHDLSVLRSVPWDRVAPRVLICEFEDAKTRRLGHTWKDIVEYIESRGYNTLISEWFPIVEYGRQHRWRGWTDAASGLADEHAWGNILAARDDRDFELLRFGARVHAAQQVVIDGREEMVRNRDAHIAELRVELESIQRPSSGLHVFYLPAFDSTDALSDQLARACWYLRVMEPERIYFVLASGVEVGEFRAPDYLDPDLQPLYESIRDRIELLSWRNQADVVAAFRRSRVVMHWRLGVDLPDPWPKLVEDARKDKGFWRVDPLKERYEASFYARAAFSQYPKRDDDTAECRRKLDALLARHGGHKRAYVFGTGPSLARYPEFDFGDGIAIACNSMILDRALLEHVRPGLLAFADPVFHFGVSRYAASFRRTLPEVAEEFDLSIVIPLIHYPLLTAALPQLRDRIVGIPMEARGAVNLRLDREFRIEPVANILTLLLFPLACTLADEIHILGCDGRRLKDDGYFWTHNRKTQFNDEMENARVAHPAFFDIDFNRYNADHRDNVERWIGIGESMGKSFVSLTPSYIPALWSRYEPHGDSRDAEFFPSVTVVLAGAGSAADRERTVESLRRQEYPALDVLLVVSDADREGLDWARSAAAGDDRIDFVETSGGDVASLRNAGIETTSAEFVTFLEPGHMLGQGSIETRMAAILDWDHDAVFCDLRLVDEDLVDTGWPPPGARPRIDFLDMDERPVDVGTVIVRRSLLDHGRRFGGVDDAFVDWDWLARVARSGVVFNRVAEAVVTHGAPPVAAERTEAELAALAEERVRVLYGPDPRVTSATEAYAGGLGAARQLYNDASERLGSALRWAIRGDVARASTLMDGLPGALLPRLLEDELVDRLVAEVCAQHGCDPGEWRGALGEGGVQRVVETLSSRRDVEGRSSALRGLLEHLHGSHPAASKRRLEDVVREKSDAVARRDHVIAEKNEAMRRRDAHIAERNDVIRELRDRLRRWEVKAVVALSKSIRGR